jgi:hypothetical protein
MLDHSPSEAVNENVDASTCLHGGSHDEVVYCSSCHAELSREHKSDQALGHDLIFHDEKCPTCTEKGWSAYDTCSRCNYTTYEELEAIGHNYSSEILVEKTCTNHGHTLFMCTRCHDYYIETDSSPGHTIVKDVGKDPTCLESGLADGYHCSVCHEVLIKQEVLSALGHKYGSWIMTKEPTYNEFGLEERECVHCGDKETKQIAKLIDEKVTVFKQAMAGSKLSNYNELKELMKLYNLVEDKESVKDELELLTKAINDYNEKVDGINNASYNSNNIILNIICNIADISLLSYIALRILRRENNLW